MLEYYTRRGLARN